MRWLYKILISAVLLLFTFWLWPSSLEKELDALIIQAKDQINFSTTPPIFEARLKSKKIAELLAEQFRVEYRSEEFNLSEQYSRSVAADALFAAIRQITKLEVVYSQFKLIESSGSTARVSLFLIAEWQESSAAQSQRAAEDVRLTFNKIAGEWRVVQIETLAR